MRSSTIINQIYLIVALFVYNFIVMDSSRRSFKAYSVAQPLKKQIDQTLMRVELEKRRFLTFEREEAHLKEALQRRRKDLNELKAKQPQTRTFAAKTWQTGNSINNVDKNYLATHDSIQQLKAAINLHRKQIIKYKDTISHLYHDTQVLSTQNAAANQANLDLQESNERLKEEIMQFREKNLKNTTEFRQSHTHINRSSSQQENQRRKAAMLQKTFMGEQLRNSKALPFDNLSEPLRTSGIRFGEHQKQVMSGAVPLAKERIKIEIQKNREKLRISEGYRRFGQNLENMFQVMREYKGREDLNFIAQEFVTKEKQLQKIEEYIAQLQSRIQTTQTALRIRTQEDKALQAEVTTRVEKEDERYIQLQGKVSNEIRQLKAEESQFFTWFQRIGSILMPLLQEPLTRANASNQIGKIESDLNMNREQSERKLPGKALPLPAIELQEKQQYGQMLSYQKLRQFASEYVRSKKN